jgi:hypothetical protein
MVPLVAYGVNGVFDSGEELLHERLRFRSAEDIAPSGQGAVAVRELVG